VDTLLTRQFVLFSDALSDAAPSVRITAVTGVCTVLNCFWELIPSATAAGYVARLTGEAAAAAAVLAAAQRAALRTPGAAVDDDLPAGCARLVPLTHAAQHSALSVPACAAAMPPCQGSTMHANSCDD
jgi:hypothetical protein